MGKKQYLIDTNAVIDFLGNKFPESGLNFMNGVIDEIPKVSVVTKIELLGFNAPNEHYITLFNFINDAIVLDLTGNVVDECIEIRKKKKIKLPDAIIAATALVHDLILISHNLADFNTIGGLQVIDPNSL
jgi:predicted nucleic acid-binding protein